MLTFQYVKPEERIHTCLIIYLIDCVTEAGTKLPGVQSVRRTILQDCSSSIEPILT